MTAKSKEIHDSPSWKQKAVRWLEDHRELVVVGFCLPASFLFSLLLCLRNFVRRKMFGSPQYHERRVKTIQAQVQKWNKLPNSDKKLLCTSRPNWLSLSTTFYRKELCHKIAIPLYDILELDTEKMTVRVEPMVTIGDITNYLIPKGLAMGTGMSTHSHKVGLFHETITCYEVVLSDGSLVKANSDNEYADLFRTLPWSHGSLGFLVGLTLKIVKIKPFIKLKYIPVKGHTKYCDMIRELSGANEATPKYFPDYIEATIFNKNDAVIMVGDYADYDPNIPINNASRWYKPWFYKYAESFLYKGEYEELVPLRQYLLRHNRAIFWVVESMISFGNNPLFRLYLGWLLPPKPAFLKFTTTPGIRAYTFTKQVFQDIVLPLKELEKQVDESERLFETYPLLVYPCRVYNRGLGSGQLRKPDDKYMVPGTNYAMFNDLGIYGVPGKVKERKPYNPVTAMREMEKFTRNVGGFAFLYADIFMTKEEFIEMFDLTLYERVRSKYKAEAAFPHLYDKVKPEIDVFEIGRQNTI